VLWPFVYGLFVVAAAIHAAIGVRIIIREWTEWRGRSLDAAAIAFALFLLALGLRAVRAIA
jgi:fumarate reductase subunit C